MMLNQTIEKLISMHLTGMADALKEQVSRGDISDLSFDERMGLLVDREWSCREERRLQRRLKTARLKQTACVENIDYRSHRGLDKKVVYDLITCRWIRAGRNLILTGPTGIGKSWLACALGEKACREGFTVQYARVPRLIHELCIARADGSFLKTLTRLAKIDLLILDDWALAPLESQSQYDILEVIDDRVGKRSIIVTSQLPVEKWHDMIQDPSTSDAIMDRLLSKATNISLKGGSLRREGRTEEGKE
jgi:DNA replication protein DnaC